MLIKSLASGTGLLLVAGLVVAAGSAQTSAEERLPWLRDAPQPARSYAQAGTVDRDNLPPSQETQGYGDRPYSNSAPRADDTRAGEGGYERRDDRYHPPAQSGGFGSSAAAGNRRDDTYYPPARREAYGAPPSDGRDSAYSRPASGGAYSSQPTYGRDDDASPARRIESYQAPGRYDREDVYRPPAPERYDQAPLSRQASPYRPPGSDEPEWRDNRGPPPNADRYASVAPPYDDREPPPADGTYSMREIVGAGHGFFGSISRGLASVIEYAFKTQGRPNGYILGEDVGGAFVAGLRYGEGRLYTRDAGTHRVFWQGPSLGYDAGAEGSKVMVLVYNLRDPSDIYTRFGGVAGSAYVVGGVGMTFQQSNNVVLAPIRAGIGFRLGANVGYLKYTRRPTWNPF